MSCCFGGVLSWEINNLKRKNVSERGNLANQINTFTITMTGEDITLLQSVATFRNVWFKCRIIKCMTILKLTNTHCSVGWCVTAAWGYCSKTIFRNFRSIHFTIAFHSTGSRGLYVIPQAAVHSSYCVSSLCVNTSPNWGLHLNCDHWWF